MPAKSKAQLAMMQADLGRVERGEKTRTGMSKSQLSEWVTSTPKTGLPARKTKKAK